MKVPEPRKLKSGTWFIQLRLGGESIPVSALTRSDCIKQAQLIKAQHRADARELKYKTDKTVRDIIQDYIDALPAGTSPSTVRGYLSVASTRFASVMDKAPSSVRDWQAVIDAEAKSVSPKTVKNAWGLLSSALRSAEIPVPRIRLPQPHKAEKLWLEPEQLPEFVRLIHGDRFEIPMLLALHGLRRSEILAMTYDKIDLKRGTITVHGAAVLDRDGAMVQKAENKNASSRRVIPIMIPALAAAIEAVPPERRTGLIYDANPTTLYWRINTICKNNGLPAVGVHGLRHSFASLAYHLGLSAQETMELGGWADSDTMLKIYTHLAQADRLKSQNKIAAFFAENANQNA